MHESIDIYFKMQIEQEGNPHVVEFHDLGKRFSKNNKVYLRFKEPIMEENNKYNDIALVCDDNDMTIMRSGSVNMNQKFIKNQVTQGTYKNQYITTEINTYTHDYSFNDNKLRLDYDMLIEGNVVGNYQMEIRIKGVGNSE
jgi:uncharacterized beta-barrel protein YwiB (DUF1934 family)